MSLNTINPAHAGGCTPGVIRAMKETGLNEKIITKICELAFEFDKDVSASNGPPESVIIEAIKADIEQHRRLPVEEITIITTKNEGKKMTVQVDVKCTSASGKTFHEVGYFFLIERDGKWVVYDRAI